MVPPPPKKKKRKQSLQHLIAEMHADDKQAQQVSTLNLLCFLSPHTLSQFGGRQVTLRTSMTCWLNANNASSVSGTKREPVGQQLRHALINLLHTGLTSWPKSMEPRTPGRFLPKNWKPSSQRPSRSQRSVVPRSSVLLQVFFSKKIEKKASKTFTIVPS